ncbi:MAG: hypothetical protein ACI4MS_08260 [Candidatus Coproplasma sp.]
MGNVLLDEIEKRQKNIAEYSVKSERAAALRVEVAEKQKEIASIENELANTNLDVLKQEIDYLTAVAIREGVIAADVPAPDEGVIVDVDETVPTVETQEII